MTHIQVLYTLSNNTKIIVIEKASNENESAKDVFDSVVGYNSGMTHSISKDGNEITVQKISFIKELI